MRWTRAVAVALEAVMYVAFLAAALPFAWLEVSELLHYQAHPEMIKERDTALLVFAAMFAIRVWAVAMSVAVLLALYFLVTGPRAVRLSAATLMMGWLGWIAFAFFRRAAPITSLGQLYAEAVPFVVLSLLPCVVVGVRLARRSSGR